MTRRQHPEDDFHVTVAQFLAIALPKDACCWTTIEPGGKRDTLEAARLQAKGVQAGWTDIIILYCGDLFCIELKAQGKYFSKVQKAMHKELTAAGAFVAPRITKLEELEEFLLRFMPLRASTGTRAA